MNNGFLSQEEINSLLSGEMSFDEPSVELSGKQKDAITEIGRASMESAAKTLEMITGQSVTIASPDVTITTLSELKDSIDLPYLALEVKYISGIEGINLLIHKTRDAQVIASLMMGGDGKVLGEELTELDESAVSEAMNQMIGSSATTMSGVLGRSINISPPVSKVWKDNSAVLLEGIADDAKLIKISYQMKIGDLVDSEIIQLLNYDTGVSMAEIMEAKNKPAPAQAAPAAQAQMAPQPPAQSQAAQASYASAPSYSEPQQYYTEPERPRQNVEVQQASFQPLGGGNAAPMPKNIDLILDVPLEISVVLGRTRKCIKDVLNLSTGSLVELDKLAEEPVEVLVNGKTVALAEVVVVGENFGVRITSIVSNAERLKSFTK